MMVVYHTARACMSCALHTKNSVQNH
jgi:hypothetical protein